MEVAYIILLLISHLSCSLSHFSSELFVLPLSFRIFGFRETEVKFHSSLLGKPDLPPWLHFVSSAESHSGFLFGAPPLGTSSVDLEIIGTDIQSYNVSRKIYNLVFKDKKVKKNEIQLKMVNLNADELLMPFRMNRLRNIIVNDLWKESSTDGVFTSLLPASLKGDRLPPRPADKEGVYVSFGSDRPFSKELKQLELEVMPLWAHRPCPTYFKKTSYERFFRQNGFAIDWCNVKLNVNEEIREDINDDNEVSETSFSENFASHFLLRKSEVPNRSYVWDVIYTILIPLAFTFVLVSLLSLAMCCHRADILPSNQAIQLVQYPGSRKTFGALRAREYSPQPSTMTATTQLNTTVTTQIDTLNRSLADSPVNGNDLDCQYEDYLTLNRAVPPPYPKNLSLHYGDQDMDSSIDSP